MVKPRGEWYAHCEGAFAFRSTPAGIVRWAVDQAAFGRQAVMVEREGRIVGQLSAAMIWNHVSDQRLARAIEQAEERGR